MARAVGYTGDVSIPLEQGNVFRPMTLVDSVFMMTSLNPFGTGQCLSTELLERMP